MRGCIPSSWHPEIERDAREERWNTPGGQEESRIRCRRGKGRGGVSWPRSAAVLNRGNISAPSARSFLGPPSSRESNQATKNLKCPATGGRDEKELEAKPVPHGGLGLGLGSSHTHLQRSARLSACFSDQLDGSPSLLSAAAAAAAARVRAGRHPLCVRPSTGDHPKRSSSSYYAQPVRY